MKTKARAQYAKIMNYKNRTWNNISFIANQCSIEFIYFKYNEKKRNIHL